MNRVYRRINRQTRALVKTLDLDFSTLDPLVQHMPLPIDFIEIFRIAPARDYLDPEDFVFEGEQFPEQEGTFTITGGRIYLACVTPETGATLWYYSSGYTLTDTINAELEAGECNSPEWLWQDLHDLVYYATCIEINQSYPHFQYDLEMVRNMTEELEAAVRTQQSVTPLMLGSRRQTRYRDDGYGEF